MSRYNGRENIPTPFAGLLFPEEQSTSFRHRLPVSCEIKKNTFNTYSKYKILVFFPIKHLVVASSGTNSVRREAFFFKP